ncbi:hypothetical protein TNCV_4804381 [Trichonephila clavipes]|nr:hypothetical protein TNCV_4804381 [Trichonephila clavipes]
MDASKKRKTMSEANDVVLKRALYLWFSQGGSKGDPISGLLLCEKALSLVVQLVSKLALNMEKEGYSGDDVYNVDEIGINCKALPRNQPSSQKLITYFMVPKNKSIEIEYSSDGSDFELIHHRKMRDLDYDE